MARPQAQKTDRLSALLRESARAQITPELRERQAVSFAYGNVKLEEDGITRAQVVAAARETASPSASVRRPPARR